MKTNRFLRLATMVAAAAFLTTSCDKYESEFSGRLDDLEDRVTTLEEATAALKARMDAGALIKSVTPITAAPGGWRIEFTGGSPASIDLMNGEAGSNPDPVPGTPGVTPMLKVETVDGVTTLWVDYGDGEGWIDTGTPIQGPQGPQGIQGPQGVPGTPAVTPMFKVEGNTVWYNVTHTNGDPDTGTWVDTGTSIKGDTGVPGTPAVTPIFKVEGNTVWYNVTHTNGDPDTGTWVDTGTSIKGDTGLAGANGVSPLLDVRKDIVTGKITVWYNVTHTDGVGGTWVDTGYDISATGPVSAILPNDNGTVTIKMSDETKYVFGLFSAAKHFEIMNVTLNFAQIGVTKANVLFRVNPSTASVPTELTKWSLDQVATRASYVNETTAFSLQSITPYNGTGQYMATIVYEDYDTDIAEYVLALVLDNGMDVEKDEPILISSAPFSLKEVPAPTIVKTETNGTVDVAYSAPLAVQKTVTLTANPAAGYIFKQWTFKLDGETIAYEDLNGRDQTKNVNSAEIEFWMPNGELEVIPVFVDENTAFAVANVQTNGTVTAVSSAAAGTTVTLTAAPEPGYYLKSYSVAKDGDPSAETEVTIATGPSNVANQATFTMPAYDVVVTAVFAPLAEPSTEFATINGVAWAKANVNAPGAFAGAAEDFGLYYQFNSATGWNATGTSTPADQTWSTAQTSVAWDMTANNPCPAGYVVPTEAQMNLLIDREAVSLQAETMNSVSGYRFVDRATGENIFLPGASNKINQNSVSNSTNGNYWTAANATNGMGDEYVYRLYFYAAQVRVSADTQASTARSVRCVKE